MYTPSVYPTQPFLRTMPPLTSQPPPPALLARDLITEILSWLPAKPLMRFKCVCKSWHSVISDPNFAKLHLRRSPKNATVLLTLQPMWPENAPVTAYSCNASSFVVAAQEGRFSLKGTYWASGSCNGLVCVRRHLHDVDNELQDFWFRVWKPVVSFKSEKSPCLRVNLRVNQLGCTKFGFGYDELTDTYKVVAVLCDRNATEDSRRTEVKVHTFGDSCWRSIQNFPALPTIVRNEGKFIGGTLNWLAIRNMPGAYAWNNVTVDQLVIVSLDMGTETYKQFLLPNGIDVVPRVPPTLEVHRGFLFLYSDHENTHLVVWQMKEFGVENSWAQFVKVSYQRLGTPDYWDHRETTAPFSVIVPLCISERGDILMLAYTSDASEVALYDRRDKTLVFTRISNFYGLINAKDYVQSLILPY